MGGEARYLLGPGAKFIDDEIVLLGVEMESKKDKYQKIEKKYYQDDSGTSDDNGRTEMKEAILNDKDTWGKLFLVARGNFSDSRSDAALDEGDVYPAAVNGGEADMQCEWTNRAPSGGGYEHEAINYNNGGYRGCASSCINWKTRISHSNTAGSDKSLGYTALTVTLGSSSEATGSCRCYHNITSLTSAVSGRKTCVFKTTKGCYYTIKHGSTYYHIYGTENKRNLWAESIAAPTKAIWFDKKNWCIGPITRKGKKCEADEGFFTGKIPPTEGSEGAAEEEKPHCPTDGRLRWYRPVTSGSTTELQETSDRVSTIHSSLT